MSFRSGVFKAFGGDSLEKEFSKRSAHLQTKIRDESESYLMNVDEEKYIQHLVDEYRIDMPVIDFDSLTGSMQERMVPAERFPSNFHVQPGRPYLRTVVIYHLPYSGDSSFLRMEPRNLHNNWLVEVFLEDGCMCFEVGLFASKPEEVKQEATKILRHLQLQYRYFRNDIQGYNDGLPFVIREAVQSRKSQFRQNYDLLAALEVPIKKKNNIPSTFAIPVVKRQPIAFPRPRAHSPGSPPDPTINEAIYKGMLQVVHDAGQSLERLPSTYKGKREEDLRDFLLVFLEIHFGIEGSVTGETFNKAGKTDILIRYEGRNVFAAECKYWKGPVQYHKTLDQLLSYLTWRDSKAAVILFDRNRNFSADLETVRAETPKHPNYLSELNRSDDSWFNYRFHLPGDPGRNVSLAVLAFHFA